MKKKDYGEKNAQIASEFRKSAAFLFTFVLVIPIVLIIVITYYLGCAGPTV